ncbi:MAG: PmbA/TldA family metallopeptidase, partial [Candidatus Binatia bacterium]
MATEISPRSFFLDRYGLTEGELEHVLGAALSRRVDHADLYFEFQTSESLLLEESLVKKATRSVAQGVGVRVVAGERTGYAYSDEVTLERLRLAATAARAIADHPGDTTPVSVSARPACHDLYSLERAPTDVDLADKIDLLARIDVEARRTDPRVQNVIATLAC